MDHAEALTDQKSDPQKSDAKQVDLPSRSSSRSPDTPTLSIDRLDRSICVNYNRNYIILIDQKKRDNDSTLFSIQHAEGMTFQKTRKSISLAL